MLKASQENLKSDNMSTLDWGNIAQLTGIYQLAQNERSTESLNFIFDLENAKLKINATENDTNKFEVTKELLTNIFAEYIKTEASYEINITADARDEAHKSLLQFNSAPTPAHFENVIKKFNDCADELKSLIQNDTFIRYKKSLTQDRDNNYSPFPGTRSYAPTPVSAPTPEPESISTPVSFNQPQTPQLKAKSFIIATYFNNNPSKIQEFKAFNEEHIYKPMQDKINDLNNKINSLQNNDFPKNTSQKNLSKISLKRKKISILKEILTAAKEQENNQVLIDLEAIYNQTRAFHHQIGNSELTNFQRATGEKKISFLQRSNLKQLLDTCIAKANQQKESILQPTSNAQSPLALK